MQEDAVVLLTCITAFDQADLQNSCFATEQRHAVRGVVGVSYPSLCRW